MDRSSRQKINKEMQILNNLYQQGISSKNSRFHCLTNSYNSRIKHPIIHLKMGNYLNRLLSKVDIQKPAYENKLNITSYLKM